VSEQHGSVDQSMARLDGVQRPDLVNASATSAGVNARFVDGPVSVLIHWAMSRLIGARVEKCVAPGTGKNTTRGFVEARAMALSDLMLPPAVPSKTNVGTLIDESQRPGDRSSTSRRSAALNGTYSGP
jgi:hypothetical protein